MNNNINRSASPALTFLFSLLPGAGHMYLGLMRRGIEIMFAFFGSIFILANTLRLPEIGIPLTIVIYFYSVFDAQHSNKAIARGQDIEDMNFIKISNQALNGYHLGIGFIVLGFLFLMDRISNYVSGFIPYTLYVSMQRSVAPLIIMGMGLYLIIKSKKINENN